MPKEISYLTPGQVDKLEAACSNADDALMIRLLFQTGARISEVLALRPCDIDHQHQRLELPALKRKDITTKLVVVDPDTLNRLRSFCKVVETVVGTTRAASHCHYRYRTDDQKLMHIIFS